MNKQYVCVNFVNRTTSFHRLLSDNNQILWNLNSTHNFKHKTFQILQYTNKYTMQSAHMQFSNQMYLIKRNHHNQNQTAIKLPKTAMFIISMDVSNISYKYVSFINTVTQNVSEMGACKWTDGQSTGRICNAYTVYVYFVIAIYDSCSFIQA